MLALLPDDYKPDFILRGLFLRRLPIDVRSHLLREKVSDPRALALKADELYQSRVSPSSVNLLADDFGESLHVNLVSSRARPEGGQLHGHIGCYRNSCWRWGKERLSIPHARRCVKAGSEVFLLIVI